MSALVSFIISGLLVFAAAYIVPGVTVASYVTALVVALVLGLLNAFVKPILLLLTLPINFLTLGLFTVVVNVIILFIASAIVPGFSIDGLIPALMFGLVLALFNALVIR